MWIIVQEFLLFPCVGAGGLGPSSLSLRGKSWTLTTSFEFQNGSRSGWWCCCIAASMALHAQLHSATWSHNCSASQTSPAIIGDRAFQAAAASAWNRQQESLRASPSLPVFRSRLKTELMKYCTKTTFNKLQWQKLSRRYLISCQSSEYSLAT